MAHSNSSNYATHVLATVSNAELWTPATSAKVVTYSILKLIHVCLVQLQVHHQSHLHHHHLLLHLQHHLHLQLHHHHRLPLGPIHRAHPSTQIVHLVLVHLTVDSVQESPVSVMMDLVQQVALVLVHSITQVAHLVQPLLQLQLQLQLLLLQQQLLQILQRMRVQHLQILQLLHQVQCPRLIQYLL